MVEHDEIYFDKAMESLLGAENEFINGRYNNCANRSYYSCFQAAIHALLEGGVRPPGQRGQWGHDFVQAHFVGELINRRKLYPAGIRDTLVRNLELRQAGDYRQDHVSQVQASRALRRAREFLEAVEQGGDRT